MKVSFTLSRFIIFYYPHHGLKLRDSQIVIRWWWGEGGVTNWLVSLVWRRLGNLRPTDRRTDRYVSYVIYSLKCDGRPSCPAVCLKQLSEYTFWMRRAKFRMVPIMLNSQNDVPSCYFFRKLHWFYKTLLFLTFL